ncbi:restriction endonuclease subunit S [Nitrosospira multiformis]|uniref:restriction endonuclease subunit S n=1 Tax=Nitrosospira multiformis TaxID=1231 RepID=UPI0009427902|nr:restriction endonuclease subunit S [Nitrosospira multiformis]
MAVADWKPVKLDQLGFVGRGKSRHRPRNAAFLYGGPYPFFQTGDIKAANFYLTEYSQTYSHEGLAQSKLWKPGTLCITIAANIAESAILGIEGCFPDSVVGFVADPEKADVRFIKYYIEILKLQMQSVSRGTTQDNLSVDKLLSFDFLVPPLSVQQRIASILSAYDELIENSQRRIKILESMVRALYREWFIHFRFPGYEHHPRVASSFGEIPQGWEVKPVEHFGKVITGKTPSKANADFYGDHVPFVKTPDMHGNMFILDTNERLSMHGAASQSNKTLPVGSICVSCIGTIGVVSITTEDCQSNQQINSVVLTNDASREFLFLRLQDAKRVLENLGANGATMGNVNKRKFESMEIVCPPADLLVDYHRLTQPMFSQILTLSRQIQNLRRTRDLLLPRLLSGQIEVKAT